MKDNLKDIIEHTVALGNIDTLKIVGTDTETNIIANSEDRTVIINGKLKNPSADFIGTFGMPNLGKLKTILSFDEYDENSTTSVARNSENIPEAFHFETNSGDFVNDYRLMAQSVVESKVKTIIFKVQPVYGVEFNPTVDNIKRLRNQYSANSEQNTFSIEVVNGEVRIYFGDVNTHSGSLVFEKGVTGSLSSKKSYPIKQTLDILNLAGDKTFRISDQGLVEIVVDSGLAVYSYLLPAFEK